MFELISVAINLVLIVMFIWGILKLGELVNIAREIYFQLIYEPELNKEDIRKLKVRNVINKQMRRELVQRLEQSEE